MPRIPKPTNAPEGTVWFGGEVERVDLCLRVLGDDLNPEEITNLLGRQPTRAGRKGESILRPTGEVMRQRRVGAWILKETPDPDATVNEAILGLLATLPHVPAIWKSLTTRFKVDLLCHITVVGVNQGFELPPNVLQAVGELGVTLGVDIFCQSDDAQSTALTERLRGFE